MPLGAIGCSLLALDTYDITPCAITGDRTLTDPCKALCNDGRCAGCVSYQCSPTSHHCELGPLDADSDGDPSIACGGTDCNDRDPSISGKRSEVCDLVDNTCDVVIDENVVFPTAARSIAFIDGVATPSVVRDEQLGLTLASWVQQAPNQPPCITVVSDTQATGDGNCISFPVAVGVPAQPYSRLLDSSIEPVLTTVYSRADSCGGLAFRSSRGGAIDPKCSDGPATLPSFLPSFNGDLLVTNYATPVLASCADARPSTLLLRRIELPGTSNPTATDPVVLSKNSASIRPAAIAAQRGSPEVLIAAPDEANGVALWFASSAVGSATTFAQIGTLPLLMGARSVDAAMIDQPGDNQRRAIALVSEIGCPPNQKVVLALVTLAFHDGVPFLESSRGFVIGLGGTRSAASPAIAWEKTSYREWRATWIVDGNVYLQRVSTTGDSIGAAIGVEVGPADYSPDARAVGFGFLSNVLVASYRTTYQSGSLDTLTMGCPR